MKNGNYLLLNCLMLSLLFASGCGKLRTFRDAKKPASGGEGIEIVPSVELMTKTFSEGSFEKGSYSFFYLSQNQAQNQGIVDIEFLDTDGTNPIINTQVSKDQIGHIVDLGLTSCKTFPNSNEQTGPYPGRGHTGLPYKEDRTLDPLFWLQYSEMYSKLKDQPNGPTAKVEVGHCYLLQRTNSLYQIIAAFHVKEYIKARSIRIDEIEVFTRSVFQN